MPKLVECCRFYDDFGELLGEEVDTGSCTPYATAPCGGCYSCMIAQGLHAGCELVICEYYVNDNPNNDTK